MLRNPLPLSNEPSVQEWIQQFDYPDQAYVRLLCDELRFVTAAEVNRWLSVELSILVSGFFLQSNKRIVCIPIPELHPRQKSYFEIPKGNRRTPGWRQTLRSFDDKAPEIIQYKKDIRNPGIGSEANMAQIITRVGRRNNRSKMILHPTVGLMRKEQTKDVVFIEDNIASGNRAVTFVQSFLRHPSVKSWFSSRRFNITILCYSISDRAEKLLSNMGVRVHSQTQCPTLFSNTNLTSNQKERIRAICIKHTRRENQHMAMGFKGSESMLIFEFGSTNNIPAIFHKIGKGGFRPLFRNEQIPQNIIKWLTPSRFPRIVERYYRIRRFIGNLAQGEEIQLQDFAAVTALDCIRKGFQSPVRIADASGISQSRVSEIIEKLKSANFVNLTTGRITEKGLKLLRKAEQEQESKKDLQVTLKMYLPKTFSGG